AGGYAIKPLIPHIWATAQNTPEELYVHQPTAVSVNKYPNKGSIGIRTPTSLVKTTGRKQWQITGAAASLQWAAFGQEHCWALWWSMLSFTLRISI
ncbi:hypothetical protein IFM61606_10553, partial [Aspergillus udagawae]